jgi:NitT/TauT family transport system ATP-binding protein
MRTKIEVKDVQKSFDGDGGPLAVVSEATFSVGDGEFVALVGPSGCGTTRS